jgi:hypothetical protein
MGKPSKKQSAADLSETIFDAAYETQSLLHSIQSLRNGDGGCEYECVQDQISVLEKVADEKLGLALEGAHRLGHYFEQKPARQKSTAIKKAVTKAVAKAA